MTNLAVTIPSDEITLGVGEPVFSVLYERMKDHPRLLALAHEREQYGIHKYGQTLMTGDERNTQTEIMNELLDAMAYMQKWMIVHPEDDWMYFSLGSLIFLVDGILQEIDNDYVSGNDHERSGVTPYNYASPEGSNRNGVGVVITEDQTVADVATMLVESFGDEWFNELQKAKRGIDGKWQ